jgi:hypothetical protein
MTRVYKSEAAAEAAKVKAARFPDDVLGDPDRASEIEGESLDEWLSETGRRIENPISNRRNHMPKKTAKEYAAEVRALREERDTLAEENEDLNSLLDEIQDLSGGDDDDDAVDTDDDDDDDDE